MPFDETVNGADAVVLVTAPSGVEHDRIAADAFWVDQRSVTGARVPRTPSDSDRRWCKTARYRDVLRAKALLLAADRVASTRIGAELGVSPTTVSNWRERVAADGLKGIGVVRPGRGRPPSIPAQKVAAIVRATLHEMPEGETHRSCRTMAKAQGVSPATVQRIWSGGSGPRGSSSRIASRRLSSRTTSALRRSSSMWSACI